MTWEKSSQIRRTLTLKCAASGIPVSGTFELTPRCNLNCHMCYVRLTPAQMKPLGKELSKEQWIELAQQAKAAGMIFLLLTGGEPTLRSDFPEIYEALAKMGFSISINSNGTLFHQKLRTVFHRLPPAQVNITLYGLSREDYAELCGNPDVYDNVMDTLEWLKNENILVHLNVTMTPKNYEKWKLFEEFAKSRNLDLRMTTYCFPPVRRNDCQEFTRLSPQEAGELTVLDLLYREGKNAVRQKRDNLPERVLNSCKLDVGDPVQCMAAKSQFWVNWNGSMVPCGMLSVPATHPVTEGFLEAWNSLKNQTEEIRLCPDCAVCPDKKTCMNCAAVIFTETGRFDGKPEYMCKMNQAYQEALEKYSV